MNLTYLKLVIKTTIFICLLTASAYNWASTVQRQTVNAVCIPLVDHYAALVAHERYRNPVQFAAFEIKQIKYWNLLRAYFQSGEADMRFDS